MIDREIIKIVYKIHLNKTLEINKVINKALQRFVNIVIKQIHFFFDKCIKKIFNYCILKKLLQ